MKFGMKNMLGLGFIGALMGLASGSTGKGNDDMPPLGSIASSGVYNSANPIWFGKSQKTKKSNRKRYSTNAKLKRRRN